MDDAPLLRALVDAAPMAAVVVGHDHTIRAWNAAAADVTGHAAADVLGRPDPTLPPDDDTTDTRLDGLLTDPGSARRTVVERIHADGRRILLVLESASGVDLDDGPGLAVWFREATDVDALLVRRNRLSRRLIGTTRADEAIEVLAEAVHGLLDATSATVLRTCPPRQHLHGMRGIGMETEVAEQVELDLDDAGTPWAQALSGQLGDGAMDLDGELLDTTFVPMGPEDGGWVLAVHGRRVAAGDRRLQDVFRAVADEAWAALQRVALVDELDGKIEILEATNRLATSVGLELAAALESVTRHAAEALSCERAAVYLVEGSEVRLAHVHASDASPEELLAEDEGLALARAVVEQREEVLYQDVTACEIAEGPWHADAGSVAVMGLPLQVAGRMVGALVVAHTVAHPRGFTSLCQQVGAAVAQQASLAVEHARLFEAERDHVQRLQELDRLKADWMAGVTHDLKSPVTTLLGFVETLRRMTGHVSEDQQREFLEIMSRQAGRLVALIEDLLLSARVDADAVARRRQLVAVTDLVDDLLAGLDPEHRAVVEVRDDGVRDTVLGDRSHLHRVLHNLVTNALTHGGTAVTVELGHDDGRLLVAVEDDGPGIPPDEREHVFERFVHGDSDASSGLGLYVARGIVEAHDGTIVVTDRADGRPGARFELRFPRGRPQREQDLGAEQPDEERRREPRPL